MFAQFELSLQGSVFEIIDIDAIIMGSYHYSVVCKFNVRNPFFGITEHSTFFYLRCCVLSSFLFELKETDCPILTSNYHIFAIRRYCDGPAFSTLSIIISFFIHLELYAVGRCIS